MSYIGRAPTDTGEFQLIDEISSSFDGSVQSFDLKVGTLAITPSKENIIVAIDGVLQDPNSAYNVSGSTITFSEAPDSSATFYGVLTGQVGASIANSTITNDHVSGTAAIDQSKLNLSTGIVSSSAQIASDISGSYLGQAVVSSSAQIASAISGSVVGGVSGSATSTGSFGRAELTTIGGGNLTFDGTTLAVTGDIDPSDAATSRTNLGLGTGDSPTFGGGTFDGNVAFAQAAGTTTFHDSDDVARGAVQHGRRVSLSTSAATIASGLKHGTFAIVVGRIDSSNGFVDLVVCGNSEMGGTATEIHNFENGSPANRTYSMSTDALQVALASGNATCQVYAISMNI